MTFQESVLSKALVHARGEGFVDQKQKNIKNVRRPHQKTLGYKKVKLKLKFSFYLDHVFGSQIF